MMSRLNSPAREQAAPKVVQPDRLTEPLQGSDSMTVVGVARLGRRWLSYARLHIGMAHVCSPVTWRDALKSPPRFTAAQRRARGRQVRGLVTRGGRFMD
jgi:hypothetical protein